MQDLEPWTKEAAERPWMWSLGDDGTVYRYIAGPDRKDQIVVLVEGHDYYEIVYEHHLAGVKPEDAPYYPVPQDDWTYPGLQALAKGEVPVYRLKTGAPYRILSLALDSTNRRDGESVVVYCAEDAPENVFVCELHEFLKKFSPEPPARGDVPSLSAIGD